MKKKIKRLKQCGTSVTQTERMLGEKTKTDKMRIDCRIFDMVIIWSLIIKFIELSSNE